MYKTMSQNCIFKKNVTVYWCCYLQCQIGSEGSFVKWFQFSALVFLSCAHRRSRKCARHQERSFGLRWNRAANILIERRISSPSAVECWTRKKDFTQKWFVHSFNQWALVKIAAQISRIFDWLSVSFLYNQSWKLRK